MTGSIDTEGRTRLAESTFIRSLPWRFQVDVLTRNGPSDTPAFTSSVVVENSRDAEATVVSVWIFNDGEPSLLESRARSQVTDVLGCDYAPMHLIDLLGVRRDRMRAVRHLEIQASATAVISPPIAPVFTVPCLIQARQQVARLIGSAPEELIFPSGGTESNNWAIKGVLTAKQTLRVRGNPAHIVISEIEHSSVLEIAKYLERVFSFEVTRIKPNRAGLIAPEAVQECLRLNTALVAIMMVNNEVGSIQPIRQIAQLLRPRGIHFHVDGVQGVGKLPVNVKDLEVDTLSFAARKFYGPKGVGALYVRRSTAREHGVNGTRIKGPIRLEALLEPLCRCRPVVAGFHARHSGPPPCRRLAMPAMP